MVFPDELAHFSSPLPIPKLCTEVPVHQHAMQTGVTPREIPAQRPESVSHQEEFADFAAFKESPVLVPAASVNSLPANELRMKSGEGKIDTAQKSDGIRPISSENEPEEGRVKEEVPWTLKESSSFTSLDVFHGDSPETGSLKCASKEPSIHSLDLKSVQPQDDIEEKSDDFPNGTCTNFTVS